MSLNETCLYEGHDLEYEAQSHEAVCRRCGDAFALRSEAGPSIQMIPARTWTRLLGTEVEIYNPSDDAVAVAARKARP